MTGTEHKVLISAADFFKQSGKRLLTVDDRLHAETLIASVARMAGSLMYRSFAFDKTIEPGTPVLSDQANLHGPKLMDLMFSTLQQLGDKVDQNSLNAEYASPKHALLSFKESHDRLAPAFLSYCRDTRLAFDDAAMGAAIATAILVHDCTVVLSADKGSAIAVYGFVEGTKTAPFPVALSEPAVAAEKKKPWYKVW